MFKIILLDLPILPPSNMFSLVRRHNNSIHGKFAQLLWVDQSLWQPEYILSIKLEIFLLEYIWNELQDLGWSSQWNRGNRIILHNFWMIQRGRWVLGLSAVHNILRQFAQQFGDFDEDWLATLLSSIPVNLAHSIGQKSWPTTEKDFLVEIVGKIVFCWDMNFFLLKLFYFF